MRIKWYLVGEAFLTVYLYFISYFYTLTIPLTWSAPIRLLLIGSCVHFICRWLSGKHIMINDAPGKKDWRFGVLLFCVVFLVMGLYYVAYYPGGLIVDTFNQWYQVDKGYLVDWHPAIHTLLFLWVRSLFCDSLAFVNFMQIIWIGMAVAYLGMVLECWGIRKRWCFLACFLGIAVPSSAIVMSFCWKDTALSIFAIILAAQVIQIFFSEGDWLRKWPNLLCFSGFCALAALMRHNAILLIGPLIFLIAVLYWKKIRYYGMLVGICTLTFVALIKGPLYKVLEVQPHSQVSAEMLGLPMTILANVLVNEPEKLDPETKEFLYRIGDQELWEENYREGSWNSAKWMGDDISNDVIEEEGAEKVLEHTWNAIRNSGYYAYRAVVKLTEVVWKPLGNHVEWSYHVNVQEGNAYGYETAGFLPLQKFLDGVRDLSVNGTFLCTWCWHLGFYILMLLFAGISRLKANLCQCILWIPVLCYNFGTALLLCGQDFRFFSFNTVISFALIVAIFCRKEEMPDEQDN